MHVWNQNFLNHEKVAGSKPGNTVCYCMILTWVVELPEQDMIRQVSD